MLDIQTMCSYIQKAAEAEEIDLDSEMIADFCLASDTYDSLTEDEQAAVNSGIREALETVRNRIAAQISSVNGVTVTGIPGMCSFMYRRVLMDSRQCSSCQKLIRVLCRSFFMT